MKWTLIIMIFTTCFASCTKDRTGIQGKWEWVKSTGGISGSTETPESIGMKKSLKIDENTIEFYSDGDLTQSTSYSLEMIDSPLFGYQTEMVVMDNFVDCAYELNDDMLILKMECSDCFTIEYKRK